MYFARYAYFFAFTPIFCISAIADVGAVRGESSTPAGFRMSLFNGENLDGWQIANCEAGVEGGLLVIQSGDGLVRTDYRYGDFVLEWECRPRKSESWDSGVYFRCELPEGNSPWPQRYQINLKQADEGNLIGFPAAKSQGLIKPGDWNAFKLTVVGPAAELEINGQPAWKTDGIEATEGYIALQVETPGGGQYEFRNLVVTELGYRSLFSGHDLSGWEGADQDTALCWKAENELLVCTGEKGPWLRSLEQFADFNLRLNYKVKAGGNSGVYVRVPADGNHHGPGSGVEIQILDDQAERYKELNPYQYTASVYGIAPADPRVSREAEKWNTLEIDCAGDHYRVIHNGRQVIDADEATFPGLLERRPSGFLGLQNHSEEVWFRNLRLKTKE